ncbi:MAG: hypothetical protein J0L97_00540 [Alphaproteobacteria bacterium]|nr:hypothetical protein [Alphaproteobacteria bacterium]
MTDVPLEAIDRSIRTIQDLGLFKGLELRGFELALPIIERARMVPTTLQDDDYNSLYITFADWALSKTKNIPDETQATEFVADVIQVALWAHQHCRSTSTAYAGFGLDAAALAFYAKDPAAYVATIHQTEKTGKL